MNLVTHSSGFDWWRRSIGAIQSDHPCHAGMGWIWSFEDPKRWCLTCEPRTVTSYLVHFKGAKLRLRSCFFKVDLNRHIWFKQTLQLASQPVENRKEMAASTDFESCDCPHWRHLFRGAVGSGEETSCQCGALGPRKKKTWVQRVVDIGDEGENPIPPKN